MTVSIQVASKFSLSIPRVVFSTSQTMTVLVQEKIDLRFIGGPDARAWFEHVTWFQLQPLTTLRILRMAADGTNDRLAHFGGLRV